MSTIRPSGHCFDDMLAFFLSRAGTAAVLVHGILASDGTRYAHAWVEEDGLAWESGIDPDGRQMFYAVAALDFVLGRHVERCTRYTFLDVVRENRTHGTHGPWDPDYRALCGRGGTILGKTQTRVLKVAR
jgi:hypothetical protein